MKLLMASVAICLLQMSSGSVSGRISYTQSTEWKLNLSDCSEVEIHGKQMQGHFDADRLTVTVTRAEELVCKQILAR